MQLVICPDCGQVIDFRQHYQRAAVYNVGMMIDVATVTGLARSSGLPRQKIERALEASKVEVQLRVDGVNYFVREQAEQLIEQIIGGAAAAHGVGRVVPEATSSGSPCR